MFFLTLSPWSSISTLDTHPIIPFLPLNFCVPFFDITSMVKFIFHKVAVFCSISECELWRIQNYHLYNLKKSSPRTRCRVSLESFITQSTVFLFQTCDVAIGNFYHKYQFYVEMPVWRVFMWKGYKSINEMFLQMSIFNRQNLCNIPKKVIYSCRKHIPGTGNISQLSCPISLTYL